LPAVFRCRVSGFSNRIRPAISESLSKESRPKGPGFGLPPGRGLSMTLLCSTYLWSVGVMEYWKNENPTPIFCNFKQSPSRISDV
jgi:hypothetical protein